MPPPTPPGPPKDTFNGLGGRPPFPVLLPVIVMSERFKKPPELRIPPPPSPGFPKLPSAAGKPSLDLPLVIVNPEIATVMFGLILKIRKFGVPPALLRIIVSRFTPGPWTVRFLSINNSPLVNVIGLVT